MARKFFKVCNFSLFLIFITIVLPCFLCAEVHQNEIDDNVENPICIQSSVKGLINVYENLKPMAYIRPEIFVGDEESPVKFIASGNAPDIKWTAKLPDGNVTLQTSVKVLKSGVHIRYIMIPQQAVKIPKIRIFVNFPYEDWLGDSYQLGPIHGIIPKTLVSHITFAHDYASSLNLGPAHTHDGLTVDFTFDKFLVALQDGRKWNAGLGVLFLQGVPADKPWIWKAGEKKVFDFTVFFNRKTITLSDELASLEPKKPILKPIKLTPVQLAWGETQLKRMLQDRPAMEPYIRPGDDLWKWMVRRFAGEFVQGGIWWDAREPEPLWDSSCRIAWNEKKAEIRVAQNCYMDKNSHWGEPKSGPVLWNEAVFEILNLSFSKFDSELYLLWSRGEVSRNYCIMRIMLQERLANKKEQEFFNNLWTPHCRKLSLPYEDQYLIWLEGSDKNVLSREEFFKNYFIEDSPYFQLIASYYDQTAGKR